LGKEKKGRGYHYRKNGSVENKTVSAWAGAEQRAGCGKGRRQDSNVN